MSSLIAKAGQARQVVGTHLVRFELNRGVTRTMRGKLESGELHKGGRNGASSLGSQAIARGSGQSAVPLGLRCAVRGLGGLVTVATALPFIRAQRWWIRVFDFPRLQVTVLGVAAVLGGVVWSRQGMTRADRVLLRMVKLAVLQQLLQVVRYTPLAVKETVRRREGRPGCTVRLITANVRMGNRQSRPLLQLVEEQQPDLLLVLEPDCWWEKQLCPLNRHYPYSIRCPLNNTYGLLLLSKLELIHPELRFLVQSDVPSVRTRVRLPSGADFLLYGVHPKPPGRENRQGNIRGSGPRDAELIGIAKEVEALNEPTS